MNQPNSYRILQFLSFPFPRSQMDIPKAPGLGLMLKSVNYDAYNKRFGQDGCHRPIDWDLYTVKWDAIFQKNFRV